MGMEEGMERMVLIAVSNSSSERMRAAMVEQEGRRGSTGEWELASSTRRV